MDTVFDFFALRPVFTEHGMRVVWWLYVINALLQAYIGVDNSIRLLAERGGTVNWVVWSPNFLPLVLGVVVQIALVRLVFEVAAAVLSGRRF